MGLGNYPQKNQHFSVTCLNEENVFFLNTQARACARTHTQLASWELNEDSLIYNISTSSHIKCGQLNLEIIPKFYFHKVPLLLFFFLILTKLLVQTAKEPRGSNSHNDAGSFPFLSSRHQPRTRFGVFAFPYSSDSPAEKQRDKVVKKLNRFYPK